MFRPTRHCPPPDSSCLTSTHTGCERITRIRASPASRIEDPMNLTPQAKDALKTEEYWINMGPQHPSTHGVLRLVMKLDGETVLQVIPHLGYIHRAKERMSEW